MTEGIISAEQFEQKVVKLPDLPGCWIWMGQTDGNFGYGRVEFKVGGERRSSVAHRVSYSIFVGPIPNRMDVLHSCDVPCCVNPWHLRVGTDLDNMRDASTRGGLKARWQCHIRGSDRPHAILTEGQVADIRKKFLGGIKQADLSREYNRPPDQIWKIVHGKTWRHVL